MVSPQLMVCQPNSPSNYLTIYIMGAHKIGFDSAEGFPSESSSHMVYKILYVNSFYVFYYFSPV